MKNNRTANAQTVTAHNIICTEINRESDVLTAVLGNGREVFHASIDMHYGIGGGWCVYRPAPWNGCGDLILVTIKPTRAEAHTFARSMDTCLY